MSNKFKKGDNVIVITGSSKGKIGKILKVVEEKVLVEGVNFRTLHKKPSAQQPGQVLKQEKMIHISNISHVEDGKPVKIKFSIVKGDHNKKFSNKDRVSKKTSKKID